MVVKEMLQNVEKKRVEKAREEKKRKARKSKKKNHVKFEFVFVALSYIV